MSQKGLPVSISSGENRRRTHRHPSSCDLYVVGAGCDIHRLNLEQGRFLNPLTTQALGVNVCKVNQDHHLFTCGTTGNNVLK